MSAAAEIVARACDTPVTNIGQISVSERRELAAAVRRGDLVTARAPWAGVGPMKTIWGASHRAIDDHLAASRATLMTAAAMDAANRKPAAIDRPRGR